MSRYSWFEEGCPLQGVAPHAHRFIPGDLESEQIVIEVDWRAAYWASDA